MLQVDRQVPLSPLFALDLAGRVIYLGYGPERKDAGDWEAYAPARDANGVIDENTYNPFVPLVVFPRFCRDVAGMDGAELLGKVFLTRFRCLEMSQSFTGSISGAAEDDELMAGTYMAANLYPYKLRPDTFYTNGFKLPQTQMLYARGPNQGASPKHAEKLGQEMLAKWNEREAGQRYEDWLPSLGNGQVDLWYEAGCTLIPTFEACNGVHVVNRDFGLEDYWPGRAVAGLHTVVEVQANQAPEGTILTVLRPGYITANRIVPAQVIVSSGAGYVSPNAADPLPQIPNFHLPHSRTMANWRLSWLPTHPQHFEDPALWGWCPTTGRFLQVSGPIWDPLHYVYGSLTPMLEAFEKTSLEADKPMRYVPVPEEMFNRFYPIVPLEGFDAFSATAYLNRRRQSKLPRSMIVRHPTAQPTAGIGYHPMPAEFEFELDPFNFPEFHPLNREHGPCPEELLPRVAGIITPKVTPTEHAAACEQLFGAPWLTSTENLVKPDEKEPLRNFPHLARYLLAEMELPDIFKISPVPFLSSLAPLLPKPAQEWWQNEDGSQLDGPAELGQLGSGIYDTLWDFRQRGVDFVKFRHMLYQTNLPLYIIGWWSGANPDLLQEMTLQFMQEDGLIPNLGKMQQAGAADEAQQQSALAQIRERQVQPRNPNRAIAPAAAGTPEEAF
ncbi:MAG: hypothetical protein EBQ80_01690 [Proteobacteria bacterium]|nr:hypothetical protein [Pseudomonadota bacterium]